MNLWQVLLGTIALVVMILWGVKLWLRATSWGLPTWPVFTSSKPLVCETCQRTFPYLNESTLPKGMESLKADGLLVLHVRAQHHEAPGFWHGKLPKTKRKVCKVLRPPPEVWHQQRNHKVTRLRKVK